MPADSKPIFRPEAIRPHLQKFALSDVVRAFQPRLGKWAALLESEEGLSRKETDRNTKHHHASDKKEPGKV